MAKEIDFNDAVDDILLSENISYQKSYNEGFESGSSKGNPEGYHLGYHRGAELGREIGYYLGTVTYHLEKHEKAEYKLYSEKILSQLLKIKEIVDLFPRTNSEEVDILGIVNELKAQYKKTCALLKISSNLPYGQGIMELKTQKLRNHLNAITNYLTPYLKLANCHMVEYFTNKHWEKLLPTALRVEMENSDLDESIQKFWNFTRFHEDKDSSELSKFITMANSHYLKVDGEFCLSEDQFKERIKAMGVEIQNEIQVKQFMSAKKSYEVQKMSSLVASLFKANKSTHCVDVGGGQGYLSVFLDLGYSVPSLAVDNDMVAIEGGRKRDRLIKKQWSSIAISECDNNMKLKVKQENLHHFVYDYVTSHTDLPQIVYNHFPECTKEDIRLLLTGLHSCGDLGPDSLRMFVSNPKISAILNIPCCYHLLTEATNNNIFWNAIEEPPVTNAPLGFPMSEYLMGYVLGRNSRMTAAQSIERVTSQKQMPSISLLYRALLEKLIKEHLPNSIIPEGKLKGTASKAKNFEEYIKLVDAILDLGLHDTLTVKYTSELYGSSSCEWKQMCLFYLLRMCLAQVVEAVVLLDRLLFLYENGYYDSVIVKVFDANLSPRCHAIVALRN